MSFSSFEVTTVLPKLNFTFRYIDEEMQTDYYFLVMEYCPGGDLRDQILLKKNLQQRFDVRQVIEWSLQVASALKFCHDRKVIHRDLKVSL